ncbi:hypothetical protein ACHQM5_022506 [Ranunculus cassubicifolius]
MQRSRKALLQRRVLGNVSDETKDRFLYKVTLSLVFVLWGSVFLLNLWISHGDNYAEGSAVNKTTWEEAELRSKNRSSIGAVSYNSLERSNLSTLTTSSKPEICSAEPSSVEENESKMSSIKNIPEVEIITSGMKSEKENPVHETQAETPSSVGVKQEKETPKQEKGSPKQERETPKQEKESTKTERQAETSTLPLKQEKEIPKSERLSRAAPLGLDEFKSRASSPKGKPVTGRAGTITHRLETGGEEHNYASASKGAKVLSFNKEAKGASNILGKDKDKYLRNPCSAEEKYVIIELSEETLVDTIQIANLEHHSSNLKDFELLGSSVYPTDKWVSLGNFTAGNVKHAQRFILQDPKWVRYLYLNLLSHYGAEFYCTVSYVEIYGVDAVERMLEDLISDQDHSLDPEQPIAEPVVKPIQSVTTTTTDDLDQEFGISTSDGSATEKSNAKPEVPKNSFPDKVPETRPPQAGRLPGDTALKILMQKVRSLDLNLLILERYLEELNSRYGNIFKELDDEIAAKDTLLEKIRADLKSCGDRSEINAKDVAKLGTWKSLVSLEMESLIRDNIILRSDVRKVLENQRHMEHKGLVIFILSFIFGCLAFTKVLIDMVVSVFRIQEISPRKFCGIRSSWFVLLLSCTIICVLVL